MEKNLKCPGCGAPIDLQQGDSRGICAYCGSKVVAEVKTTQDDNQPPQSEKEKREARINHEWEMSKTRKRKWSPKAVIGVVVVMGAIILIMLPILVLNGWLVSGQDKYGNVVWEWNLPTSVSIESSTAAVLVDREELRLEFPDTPDTVSYIINVTDTVITQTVVNSVRHRIDEPDWRGGPEDVLVTLTFKCRKIYDWQGDQGSGAVFFRVLVTNLDGELIITEKVYQGTVSVNQVFETECELVLPSGGFYVIQIDDYIT